MDMEYLGRVLPVLDYVITPFSLIGASLMLCFCLKKKQTSISFKLMAALAASDILLSASGIMNIFINCGPSSTGCSIQAGICRFFFTMSIFITSSIAVLHYKLGILDQNFNQSTFFLKTIIIGAISSIIASIG